MGDTQYCLRSTAICAHGGSSHVQHVWAVTFFRTVEQDSSAVYPRVVPVSEVSVVTRRQRMRAQRSLTPLLLLAEARGKPPALRFKGWAICPSGRAFSYEINVDCGRSRGLNASPQLNATCTPPFSRPTGSAASKALRYA